MCEAFAPALPVPTETETETETMSTSGSSSGASGHVVVPMHRHRTNRDGNAAEGSIQVVFGARFKLAVNSSASQRVGYATPMYSLPSVSEVRGLTRPRGLKPRGGQIALPYELEGLWLEVYREGGIAVHVVDEPANGYTRGGCGDCAIRIQADDGMKFEV